MLRVPSKTDKGRASRQSKIARRGSSSAIRDMAYYSENLIKAYTSRAKLNKWKTVSRRVSEHERIGSETGHFLRKTRRQERKMKSRLLPRLIEVM